MENIKSDNASEIAEKFAAERNAQGYAFNFSLESLEKEYNLHKGKKLISFFANP